MSHTPSIEAFPKARIFKFLTVDTKAWDLAYLSWPFEKGTQPDAHFSVNIHRTLQMELKTGAIDLAGALPDSAKVRSLIKGPPPQIAYKLATLPTIRSTFMFKAYGDQWLEALHERSRLFREPPDGNLDFEIKVLTQAVEVIAKVR